MISISYVYTTKPLFRGYLRGVFARRVLPIASSLPGRLVIWICRGAWGSSHVRSKCSSSIFASMIFSKISRVHSHETKSTQEYTCGTFFDVQRIHYFQSLNKVLGNFERKIFNSSKKWSFYSNQFFEKFSAKTKFRSKKANFMKKLPLDVLQGLAALFLNERIGIFYHTDTFRYLQTIDIIRFYTAMCSEN